MKTQKLQLSSANCYHGCQLSASLSLSLKMKTRFKQKDKVTRYIHLVSREQHVLVGSYLCSTVPMMWLCRCVRLDVCIII